MPADLIIRPAVEADIPSISRIYNHAIAHSTATFALDLETEEYRRDWFFTHGNMNPVLVAEQDGVIAAWASLSPYSPRKGYRRTAEDSIYVDEAFRGRGIGKQLFAELIDAGRTAGLRTIIARISTTQTESIGLHRAAGFEEVGTLRRVGEKFGKLLDVCIMQYMYASPTPGEDPTES